MRKSRVETAKTCERIVKAAGAEFAANGISDAALARVMAAAGLTHGGFYRHFASKDQLVLEACSKIVFSLIAGLELLVKGKPHRQALRLLVGRYVRALIATSRERAVPWPLWGANWREETPGPVTRP